MTWEALGVLAGLLLGVANLALHVFTWRRETKRDDRIAAIEEARREEEIQSRLTAKLSASIERGKHSEHIIVTNDGPATAYDVKVELVRAIGGGRLPRFTDDVPDIIPLSELHAGHHIGVGISIVMGVAGTIVIRLSWKDGHGPQEREITLSLFSGVRERLP